MHKLKIINKWRTYIILTGCIGDSRWLPLPPQVRFRIAIPLLHDFPSHHQDATRHHGPGHICQQGDSSVQTKNEVWGDRFSPRYVNYSFFWKKDQSINEVCTVSRKTAYLKSGKKISFSHIWESCKVVKVLLFENLQNWEKLSWIKLDSDGIL